MIEMARKSDTVRKIDLGTFVLENQNDVHKLAKYINALKHGDSTYRPNLKKSETTKTEDRAFKGDDDVWSKLGM